MEFMSYPFIILFCIQVAVYHEIHRQEIVSFFIRRLVVVFFPQCKSVALVKVDTAFGHLLYRAFYFQYNGAFQELT